MIDTTPASDNSSRFRKNLLERILKTVIAIDDKMRDQNLQCDINRKAAKASALSPGKTHTYEFLTGKKILLSDQSRIIEQGKFIYSPLSKAFKEQIKRIED